MQKLCTQVFKERYNIDKFKRNQHNLIKWQEKEKQLKVVPSCSGSAAGDLYPSKWDLL